MGKGGPPPPPESLTSALSRALGDVSTWPRFRLPTANQEALAKVVESYGQMQLPSTPTVLGSGLPSTAESIPDQREAESFKGGVVGGGEDKPKRARRGKQGKALLHGADRTVKVYRLTEAELTRLGELSQDENTAWSRAAFCGGLLVNVVLGLLLAAGLNAQTKAAAAAIGVFALIGGCRFWRDAVIKRANGKSELDRIKEDHDFENA